MQEIFNREVMVCNAAAILKLMQPLLSDHQTLHTE